jgi:hypothetical protein
VSVQEAFDMAAKLVLCAVESDKANDYGAAYEQYMESLDFFDYVLATEEQSTTKRAVLEQRVMAYRQRADAVAVHLRSSQAHIRIA